MDQNDNHDELYKRNDDINDLYRRPFTKPDVQATLVGMKANTSLTGKLKIRTPRKTKAKFYTPPPNLAPTPTPEEREALYGKFTESKNIISQGSKLKSTGISLQP